MLYPLSEVEVVVTGLDHPEGIAVGRDGILYAGGEAGEVYRIDGDAGTTTVIAHTGGSCLGITLDREENIYVCDNTQRRVFKVTQRGEVTAVADAAGGQQLVCPNFSVFDSRGNLYFSDSGEWKKRSGVIGRLYPNGRTEIFAEGPFHFANGLALDADERFLYVVESNCDRVIRIPIEADGRAGSPEIFVEGLARIPDGLAFDKNGNLYITAYGSNAIYCVDVNGRLELVCRDDECALLCQPTNCAFGGADFDQIFVANLGARHISKLDLRVKGQKLLNQRPEGYVGSA